MDKQIARWIKSKKVIRLDAIAGPVNVVRKVLRIGETAGKFDKGSSYMLQAVS